MGSGRTPSRKEQRQREVVTIRSQKRGEQWKRGSARLHVGTTDTGSKKGKTQSATSAALRRLGKGLSVHLNRGGEKQASLRRGGERERRRGAKKGARTGCSKLSPLSIRTPSDENSELGPGRNKTRRIVILWAGCGGAVNQEGGKGDRVQHSQARCNDSVRRGGARGKSIK